MTKETLSLIINMLNSIDPELIKKLNIDSIANGCDLNLTTKDGYQLDLKLYKKDPELEGKNKIDRVLELRKLGWTQAMIAREINMSQKWVSLTLKNNSY